MFNNGKREKLEYKRHYHKDISTIVEQHSNNTNKTVCNFISRNKHDENKIASVTDEEDRSRPSDWKILIR